MHGQGTYIEINGTKYVGQYENGKKHGHGTYTTHFTYSYVGSFRDDKKHGQGTFIWINGDQWKGELKDGFKYGNGIFTWVNGEKYVEKRDFLNEESIPIFPGCEPSKKSSISDRKDEDKKCLNNGIMKHIKKNFKYPKIAKDMGIQGKIYVQFLIDKTGSITNVSVVYGNDKYLKEEAIRLVKSIPKMTPANQKGKPVGVNYTIPINFMLN